LTSCEKKWRSNTNAKGGEWSTSVCWTFGVAHKGLCAWKNNSCPYTLAQLPPLSAMLGAYIDQCETLLQLFALPMILESSINQMLNHGS
jgi:hypothetical protein